MVCETERPTEVPNVSIMGYSVTQNGKHSIHQTHVEVIANLLVFSRFGSVLAFDRTITLCVGILVCEDKHSRNTFRIHKFPGSKPWNSWLTKMKKLVEKDESSG